MKANALIRVAAVAALALMAVSVPLRAQEKTYKVGDKINDFVVKNDQGKTIKLSQYKGKLVVLTFYASW